MMFSLGVLAVVAMAAGVVTGQDTSTATASTTNPRAPPPRLVSPLEQRRRQDPQRPYHADAAVGNNAAAAQLRFPFDALDDPLLADPHLFPVFLNGVPLVFQRQRRQTRRQAVLSFLFSQGFGATDELYLWHLVPSVPVMESQVVDAQARADADDEAEHDDDDRRYRGHRRRPPQHKHGHGDDLFSLPEGNGNGVRNATRVPVALSIGVGRQAFILSFDDTEDDAYLRRSAVAFLHAIGSEDPESQTGVVDQIVAQMVMRRQLQVNAWGHFFQPTDDGTANNRVEDADDDDDDDDDDVDDDDDDDDVDVDWDWGPLRADVGRRRQELLAADTVHSLTRLHAADALPSSSGAGKEIPVWVLNLWRSPVRRLHMHRECQREGLLAGRRSSSSPSSSSSSSSSLSSSSSVAHCRLFNAVDGLSLSTKVLSHVVGEQAVLSTGEIGCFLSHLTTWRSVVREALPFAVVVEDDATLVPGFGEKLELLLGRRVLGGGGGGDAAAANGNHRGTVSWDILFLEKCGEMRERGGDVDCRAPYLNHMRRRHRASGSSSSPLPRTVVADAGMLHVDSSACVPSGVRAYAVSQRGARKLAESALPLRQAVDVYLAEMIYAGKLNAFCAMPAIVDLHPGGLASSDMASVPVFHTKVNDRMVLTANLEVGFPSCDSILCALHFSADEAEE